MENKLSPEELWQLAIIHQSIAEELYKKGRTKTRRGAMLVRTSEYVPIAFCYFDEESEETKSFQNEVAALLEAA